MATVKWTSRWTFLVGTLLLASACHQTPAGRIDRANVALSSGKVEEAITELEAGLAEAPDVAALHERYGFALRRRGDRVGSEKAYQRALELAPADQAAQLGLADLLWEVGRKAEAREAYQRFLDLPISDDQLLALARARVTTLLVAAQRDERTSELP